MSLTIDQARDKFLELLEATQDSDKAPFLHWIEASYFRATCSGDAPAIASHKLDQIADYIRDLLPQDALLPSETFVQPTKGENADCDPQTTLHVDAFLYNDDKIDELCDEGKMSRNYCVKCGSRDVKPLTFISHSASKTRCSFIFRNLVGWLKGKSVVDIGSRLGVLCYGAYVHTPANPIIGVEINEDFCKLQQQVVDKFAMGDRIKIMQADIMTIPHVLQQADVVLINNSFEFFSDENKQKAVWMFIRENTKSGAILVTVPSLEETFATLEVSSDFIDLDKWVTKKHITDPLTYHYMQDQEELADVACYIVN